MTGAGEHVEPLGPPPPLGVLVLPVDAELSTPGGLRRGRPARAHAQPRRAGAARRARAGGDVGARQRPAGRGAVAVPARSTRALAAARAAGAEHVLVSGSGPTVVGLFGGADGPARAAAAASACGWPRAVAAEPVDEAWAAVRRLMHPFPLAGAIGLAIFLAVRFRRLGRATLVLGVLVVVGPRAVGLRGRRAAEPHDADRGRRASASASGRTCSSARSRSSRPAPSSG